MEDLIQRYNKKSKEIKKRLSNFKNKNEEEYFEEFIFCLLTPQSNAQKCWEAVKSIIKLKKPWNELEINKILSKKTRFHNVKTKRIICSEEQFSKIKSKLKEDTVELRNYLAENIKGYGLKESGHFLRNIGLSNNKIAILDRHILRNLKKFGVIEEEKIRNKKDYFIIEKKFIEFSNNLGIPLDNLDLFWWSEENGEIFK